jgi:hypothetical protein
MMMIVMGHECKWGIVSGRLSGGIRGGGEKEMKDTEGLKIEVCYIYIHINYIQNIYRNIYLHVHLQRDRQHNETQQTLFEKEGRRKGAMGMQMEVNLFTVHCTHVWNFYNETLSYVC